MVDGVIYMSSSLEEETLNIINELDLKTVLVETKDNEGRLPSVYIDNIENQLMKQQNIFLIKE